MRRPAVIALTSPAETQPDASAIRFLNRATPAWHARTRPEQQPSAAPLARGPATGARPFAVVADLRGSELDHPRDILPACQLRGVAVAPPLSRVDRRATHARRRERSIRRHDAGPWLRCHPHWPQPRPRIAWTLKLRGLKHAVSVVRSRSGNGKPGRRGTSNPRSAAGASSEAAESPADGWLLIYAKGGVDRRCESAGDLNRIASPFTARGVMRGEHGI
jgi:hypothetical protein